MSERLDKKGITHSLVAKPTGWARQELEGPSSRSMLLRSLDNGGGERGFSLERHRGKSRGRPWVRLELSCEASWFLRKTLGKHLGKPLG